MGDGGGTGTGAASDAGVIETGAARSFGFEEVAAVNQDGLLHRAGHLRKIEPRELGPFSYQDGGIGLRDGGLGNYAILLGVLGGGGIVVSNILSEAFERRLASGKRIYNGGGGFDFDDLLYLLGPAAWLGWLAPILVGASIGAPVMALISGLKLRKLSADRTT